MNKQLQRDLQACIQSLKAAQLLNVLAHYETITGVACERTVTKKAMNYECEVVFRGETTKGFGRNQEQSVTNAIKNLLSMLVGKNIDTNELLQSLKYKNGVEDLSSMKKVPQNKDQSLFLDDVSMIELAPSRIKHQIGQCDEQASSCTCIYYESHKYHKNEVKHLQARVNLLTEENNLLKKMLMCGTATRQSAPLDKENDSYQSNQLSLNSNTKNKQALF